jgi:hypothetical protein
MLAAVSNYRNLEKCHNMGHLRDTYLKIECWLDRGDFTAAELVFRRLPSRAITTKRGLSLWLRLSRGLERWPEVEAAASQLRVLQPRETAPVLLEAEALHHQGQTRQAVFLLVTQAARFGGPAWPAYQAALKNYSFLARQTALKSTPQDQKDASYPDSFTPAAL